MGVAQNETGGWLRFWSGFHLAIGLAGSGSAGLKRFGVFPWPVSGPRNVKEVVGDFFLVFRC